MCVYVSVVVDVVDVEVAVDGVEEEKVCLDLARGNSDIYT